MTAAVAPAAAPARPGPRPGYDDNAGATADRVLPMLDRERVVWLSTVGPDGSPHLVPTWFWWDGDSVLCWSKPGAVKVRNLRANPRLMVAVGDPGSDFSVGLIEAVAELCEVPVPEAFFEKYGDELAGGRLDAHGYRALYPQAIRITPTRFLAWRGRGDRHEARPGVDGRVEVPQPPRPLRSRMAPDGARPSGAGPAVAGWVAGCLDRLSLRLRAATAAGAAG